MTWGLLCTALIAFVLCTARIWSAESCGEIIALLIASTFAVTMIIVAVIALSSKGAS